MSESWGRPPEYPQPRPGVVSHEPASWGSGLPAREPRRVPGWFRVCWMVWSVSWALFWITVGWLLVPFFNVVLFAVSLAAAVAFEDFGRRARRL